MATAKQIIRSLLPAPVLQALRRHRARKNLDEFKNLSTQEIFSKIYDSGTWGKSSDPAQPFFSGSGSHDSSVVSTYIRSVGEFLSSLDRKPSVVDLGCGDFFVGSKIRSLCASYVACDIVPKLIAFNQERFKEMGVDFRVLDLTADELPGADVVFVRQVLQHLSNAQIQRALPKIVKNYRYLVLTEHLPLQPRFKANLDKPAGPDIRATLNSGVVLTEAPFDLSAVAQRRLCETVELEGRVVTTLYTLR